MRPLDEIKYIVTNSINVESLRGCAVELIAEVESLRTAIGDALTYHTSGPTEQAVWDLVARIQRRLVAAKGGAR